VDDELKLKFYVKMRNNFDNIELAKTIISEGVPHVEYYASSGSEETLMLWIFFVLYQVAAFVQKTLMG